MTLLGIYLYDGIELVTKNLRKETWFPFAPIDVDSNNNPDFNQMKSFVDKTTFLYNQNDKKNLFIMSLKLINYIRLYIFKSSKTD